MIQSQTITEHNHRLESLNVEFNWVSRRTKMSGGDRNRQFTLGSHGSPDEYAEDMSLLPQVYEAAIPRSYAQRVPSLVHSPPSEGTDTPQFQIFTDFTELYPSAVESSGSGSQYLDTEPGAAALLYQDPSAREKRFAPQRSPEGSNVNDNIDTHRVEQGYYYDDPQMLHDLDRETKKVRLSPCSDYESSASEYEMHDRRSAPALSPHEHYGGHKHPGIAGLSMGGHYSPDPIGTGSEFAPRSNLGYSSPHFAASGSRKKERKGRRKLAPMERQQVHQLRKLGACTRCWGLKMKCDDKGPCHRCEKQGQGTLCVRVHFVDLDVFSKWLVDGYSRTMMHHVLQWDGPARAITISHDKTLNITLQLSVYPFVPAPNEQLQYWFKDAHGWRSTPTTPFAMKRGIPTDILEKYIQDHTYHFVHTSFTRSPVLEEIFSSAYEYSFHPPHFLLRDALQLWTATQLLIHGASLHPTSDALGIRAIPPCGLPQANQIPLPNVLANQLDHLLERRIWQLEKQLLSELQKRVFARKRYEWLKIFFTLVVLMNALERDTWRLWYWKYHSEDGYAWRHPASPDQLIGKNNILAESLSAHFTAISKGINPFALDWHRQQSATLVGEVEESEREGFLESIERIGCGLRNPDHQVRIANVLGGYREDDVGSLDLLYAWKVMTL